MGLVRWTAVGLSTLLLAGSALAGPIFLNGSWKGTAFEGQSSPLDVAVRFSTTTGTVAKGAAALTVTDEVVGASAQSGAVLVPLPAGTSAEAVRVFIDGAPAGGRFVAGDAAAEAYANAAKATGLAGLLTLTGRPAYLIDARDWAGDHTLQVKLNRTVTAGADGLVRLASPMANGLFGKPPRRSTIDVLVTGARPVRGVISPTHDVAVQRLEPHQARVRVSLEAVADAPDSFELLWAEDADPVGLRVLTHRIEGEAEGYFMVLGHPTGGDNTQPVPKDLVLVVDTSGSMRGEKMAQAREAVTWTLERLNPGDRFNVITFGTEVRRFRPQVVDNSAESRAAAAAWIDEAVALGRTNISDALEAGLQASNAGGRPRMMIFLTDGSPTEGEVVPERILAALTSLNAGATRIFSLGVGHDVNTWLLDQLAEKTGGRALYATPDEEIDARVAALYESLSHPLLDQMVMDFGGLEVSKVQPAKLGALFRNQEVLVTGRYTGGGVKTVALKGTQAGRATAFTVAGRFAEKTRPEDGFVATLWAARRIGTLLRELRLDGADKAKIAEVVELSRQFGIVTEYTAFIAAEGGLAGADAATRTANLVDLANRQRSGGWAFNQVDNEQKLMLRKVSSSSANFYRDRQGKKKQVQVKQIGRKTYYKRGKAWVDATLDSAPAAPRRKRRVKRFSPEYFDLVRQNKDFARAQALEGDITIDFDDQRVEVY